MQKAKVGDLIYARVNDAPAYLIVRETHDDGTFTAHNIAHGTGYRFRDTPYQIVFSPRFYGALKELWPDPFDKKITQESEKAAKKPERVPEENSKAQIPPAHVLIGHQTILGHKIYVGLGDGYVYAGFVPFGETATISGGKMIIQDGVSGKPKNTEDPVWSIDDVPTAELREELRMRGDDVCREDMLYCRKHGRMHHSDCQECHTWLDARLAWSGEKIRTPELVAMLAKRAGVHAHTATSEKRARLSCWDGLWPDLGYPYGCTILVIPEATE